MDGDLTVTSGTLDLANSGGGNENNAIDLEGDFSMAAGGTFTAGDNTGHTVGGSWTETGGTFSPGSVGKFTFEAVGGDKTITTLASFYDLSINTG